MRNKVINHIKGLLAKDGGFDPDYEEHLGFPVPQSDVEIEALTDEQLILFLETYGIFLG
jgi:hypothetical protein